MGLTSQFYCDIFNIGNIEDLDLIVQDGKIIVVDSSRNHILHEITPGFDFDTSRIDVSFNNKKTMMIITLRKT